MAKDKSTGSWKLSYEINEKDSAAGALISADVKLNPGKVRVTMDGGIPDMSREQLAAVYLLLNEKVKEINNQPAGEIGSHIASLKLIGAYCNELANFLTVGSVLPDGDE